MNRVVAYVAERFPLRVFGPAIALLAATTIWVADIASPFVAWTALLLVSLLLAQFRLWDDLEDADRDRVAHPDRVLVDGPRTSFRILLAALAVANAALCAATWPALVSFAALNGWFLVAYRWLRGSVSDGTWRYGILPLKYPAFVLIAAFAMGTPIPERLAVAAAAAYACASAYERWHNEHMAHPGESR